MVRLMSFSAFTALSFIWKVLERCLICLLYTSIRQCTMAHRHARHITDLIALPVGQMPHPEAPFIPVSYTHLAMTYALSNSLGFGGHNACIALRRWEG